MTSKSTKCMMISDEEESPKTEMKDNVEIELFDVEEGHKLFKAIENGLKEINPYLPRSKKVIFANKGQVTTKTLYELGQKAVGNHHSTTSDSSTASEDPKPWTYAPVEPRSSSSSTIGTVERLPTPC